MRTSPAVHVHAAWWKVAAFGALGLLVATGWATAGRSSASTGSGPSRGSSPSAASSSSATPSRTATTTAAPTTIPGLAAGVVPAARSAAEQRAAAASVPTSDLPGWKHVFSDDFTTPVAAGGWARSSYASRWNAYDGGWDTHHVAQYDAGLLSVSGGVLDAALQTVDGSPRVTGLVPLVDGAWGGQLYGRYSVRFRSDAAPGYVPAFFLWPDSNAWNDGEVDFVEGDADQYVNAYDHCPTHAQDACGTANTHQVFPQWHVATLEWRPGSLVVELDGSVILRSSAAPTTKMHLVMQQMARPGVPASSTPHVQVDWVSIWSYDPATAAAPSGSPTGAPAAAASAAGATSSTSSSSKRRSS